MMKRVFSLALMSAAAPLFAATYYASPIGTSSAAGTEADPYDIATAIAKLGNNTYDDVYLLPGTPIRSAAPRSRPSTTTRG